MSASLACTVFRSCSAFRMCPPRVLAILRCRALCSISARTVSVSHTNRRYTESTCSGSVTTCREGEGLGKEGVARAEGSGRYSRVAVNGQIWL